MQTANDFRYRNLKTYQLARTLAAIVHTITLSRPGLAEKPSIVLRRSSKLLKQEIILAYRRSVTEGRITRFSSRAKDITSEILSLIQSPGLFPPGAEKDQSYLLNSYKSLFESLQSGETDGIANPRVHPSFEDDLTQTVPESDSLEGKVILITRSRSQSHSLVEGISLQGGLPVVIPMIEITDPESWESVDRTIVNLPGYDGVVFTSQNAVERFLHRIDIINRSARKVLASRQVAAVGDRTRSALEKAEIPVTLMPDHFSAKELVALLRRGPVRGKRYLFPRGDLALGEVAEVLRECDAVVDEVAVYRTMKPGDQELEPLKLGLKNGEIDAVTFFSPSSIRNFIQSISVMLVGDTVVGCIGPSTTDEARAAGFRVLVTAKEATAESMIATLISHFEARRFLHPAKG